VDDLPGDVGRLIRAEEFDGVRDLGRLAEALERMRPRKAVLTASGRPAVIGVAM